MWRVIGKVQSIENIKLCMLLSSYALRRITTVTGRDGRRLLSASLLLFDIVRELAQRLGKLYLARVALICISKLTDSPFRRSCGVCFWTTTGIGMVN